MGFSIKTDQSPARISHQFSCSLRFEYAPFGQVVSQTGSFAGRNNIRFSTKYCDAETRPSLGGTGLLYFGHRYYSPELGRWTSRDPIEENGGRNLYGFVENDPVRESDVLGWGIVDWIKSLFEKKCKCCCPPDKILIEEDLPAKWDEKGGGWGKRYYHKFKAVVDTVSVEHDEELDCTLKWTETWSGGLAPPQYAIGTSYLRYDEKIGPDEHWEKSDYPGFGLGPPGVERKDADWKLKIEIVVEADSKCPCPGKKKVNVTINQHLQAKDGKPYGTPKFDVQHGG